jgi:hypothetical protein
MNFKDDDIADYMGNYLQTESLRYRADNGTELDEKHLTRIFLFGKGKNPANPTEGKGFGGQKFGQENNTPAGNDKNNPTQMAGHTNAYFNRNEPSEEHPEDSNFTTPYQDGEPDYSKAQPYNTVMENTDPKPEKVERGNGENDRPHPQQPYTEGTVDDDGESKPNIPDPNGLPDQQKVGEDDEQEHIET